MMENNGCKTIMILIIVIKIANIWVFILLTTLHALLYLILKQPFIITYYLHFRTSARTSANSWRELELQIIISLCIQFFLCPLLSFSNNIFSRTKALTPELWTGIWATKSEKNLVWKRKGIAWKMGVLVEVDAHFPVLEGTL